MIKTFTFHVDLGHAWLKVSLDQVKKVGLTHESFSQYSFYKNNYKGPDLYLEEDQDAGRFIKAFEETNGFAPIIRERHSNGYAKIRSYNRLNA